MFEAKHYLYGTGRRKSSVARVRLYNGTGKIVINADKAVLTGKKLDNKYYRRHTGYIGGLKEVKYSTLMKTRPELAMELAVKGMVPDTTIGRKALTRLHVYSGTEYAQKAQKPELLEF